MDWSGVIVSVVEGLAGLVITVGIPWVLSIILSKVKNEKVQGYLKQVTQITASCVEMVKQTFVDSLKAEGKFDSAAQKVAFDKCKESILYLLNDEAKSAVVQVYGDFDEYIRTLIEAQVAATK